MYPTGQNPPMPAQQPIVMAIPQNLPNVNAHQSRKSIANGILQIIVGVSCILLNSLSLGLYLGWRNLGFIGHGFWGGVFYIVTGSLGISAGKNTTKCLMIAHMVLCIIAASLFVPAHFAVSVIGSLGYNEYYIYGDYNGPYVIEIVQAVLVAIEFAFAVWGSTIWCKAVGCCNDPQAMPAVHAVQIINGQPIILVQSPGGQLQPFGTQQPQYPSYPMPSAPSYTQQERKY